jgi:hypothetical protein
MTTIRFRNVASNDLAAIPAGASPADVAMDMQAERDHLLRFVFPKLRQELLQRRIHLVDVDLRWVPPAQKSSAYVTSL